MNSFLHGYFPLSTIFQLLHLSLHTMLFALICTDNLIAYFLFAHVSIGSSLINFSVAEGELISICFMLELSTPPLAHDISSYVSICPKV